MTTTQINRHDIDAKHAVNCLRRARWLTTVLRRPEFTHLTDPATLAALPQEGRAMVAAQIGISEPSKATWAMVVELMSEMQTP